MSTYIEGGQSLLISFGRRSELADAVATVFVPRLLFASLSTGLGTPLDEAVSPMAGGNQLQFIVGDMVDCPLLSLVSPSAARLSDACWVDGTFDLPITGDVTPRSLSVADGEATIDGNQMQCGADVEPTESLICPSLMTSYRCPWTTRCNVMMRVELLESYTKMADVLHGALLLLGFEQSDVLLVIIRD